MVVCNYKCCTSFTSNSKYFEQQFSLAGAKGDRFGGMLHGFSRKVLAAAWGVDEKTMSLLLDSQKDTTMIKASRKISLTDPRIRTRR